MLCSPFLSDCLESWTLLALHYGVSVCVIPVGGKATADGALASVSDEKPARDSVGRGDRVE